MENPDVRIKFLENTSRNVDRLVNLMIDLDEISKLERGEQLLYKQNFIIQELIKEVYESLSIKTAEKNILCTIKKGCEFPYRSFCRQRKNKAGIN
jgi:two-component system phosphate regulon sensor histidine kinase PhoR